ncbi:MAG TPA: ABC transporter permease [Acidimicrobiales bacterium]|nr:ABC transporter permease [Acidimicrobiales bacterium]
MGRLLKGALAHRLRLVHTGLAVALAVSLVTGTFALADTIDAAFHQAAAASPDGPAVIVRSAAKFSGQATTLPEREPVPDTLVATVRAVPGVGSAWGVVSGYAQVIGSETKAVGPAGGLPAVGTSWAPGDPLVAGRAPDGPGEVVIDQATAEAYGLGLGDRIKVLFQDVVREFVIEGLRRAGGVIGSSLAAFDLATTQQVMGQEGKLDRIEVAAAPGVEPDLLRARIAGVLPDRYEAVTDAQAAKEAEKSWTEALGFLTTGLLVFAAVALLVSAFIIFNTFSILVAQRTRELGLLRALGGSRRQVTAAVLAEALAVGAAGSVAGLALGVGAAGGLLALLRATGFDVPDGPLVFTAGTALAGLGCGLAVTVVAAALPARRATAVSPIAGAGSVGGEEAGDLRGRMVAGAALGAGGVALLGAGLLVGSSRPMLAIAAGSAALLAGAGLLAPLVAAPVARVVGAPLGRALGEAASLGRENAMRNPRRTAATAAALTIGVGLIGVVSILAASMRESATSAVERSLRADFVVTSGTAAGAATGLPPLVAERLRHVPGVQTVSQLRGGQWGLDGRTMTLLAVDPATVTDMYDLDPHSAAAARSLDDTGVIVRDTVAARHGWQVGDEVPMTFARTGTRKLPLRGTFSTTTVRTDYVISLAAYEANFAQQFDLEVDVALAAGVSAAAGRERIEKALADLPRVQVRDRAQVLQAQQDKVQQFLVPITALLGLSVVIALLGIANTLALSVHERTRELGLLRAIGMTRHQLRSMVRSEAVIISALGAVLGVGLAVVFGWVLVSSMRHLGLTHLVVPVGQLAAWMGVAVVAGLLAAALPARKAARLNVLEAVGAD